jgi:hypothetical protein
MTASRMSSRASKRTILLSLLVLVILAFHGGLSFAYEPTAPEHPPLHGQSTHVEARAEDGADVPVPLVSVALLLLAVGAASWVWIRGSLYRLDRPFIRVAPPLRHYPSKQHQPTTLTASISNVFRL